MTAITAGPVSEDSAYYRNADGSLSIQERHTAGEAFMGYASSPGIIKDLVPVLDTSIYAAGDTLWVPIELTNVARVASGVVDLVSILLLDEDDQGVALDLVFMNATGTLGTINVAPSITDAVARTIVGIGNTGNSLRLAAANYIDIGGSKIQLIAGSCLARMQCDASKSLWVGAITQGGTPTYTASGIRLKLGFEQK